MPTLRQIGPTKGAIAAYPIGFPDVGRLQIGKCCPSILAEFTAWRANGYLFTYE